jgi:hypothetical protein
VIELALRLEADGYFVARRRRAVIARTETRQDGDELARKLQLEAVVASPSNSRMRLHWAVALVAGLNRTGSVIMSVARSLGSLSLLVVGLALTIAVTVVSLDLGTIAWDF